jgi:hypothetical protein
MPKFITAWLRACTGSPAIPVKAPSARRLRPDDVGGSERPSDRNGKEQP